MSMCPHSTGLIHMHCEKCNIFKLICDLKKISSKSLFLQNCKLLVCERAHMCRWGNFCAIGCGKNLENVHAGACVNHFLGAEVRAHLCSTIFHFLAWFFLFLEFWAKKNFLWGYFFRKNVRVHAQAQKLGYRCVRRTLPKCVRCACGCGRKFAHTNSLQNWHTRSTNFGKRFSLKNQFIIDKAPSSFFCWRTRSAEKL